MINCLLELNIGKIEFEEKVITLEECRLLDSNEAEDARIDLYEVYVPEENKCFFISKIFYKESTESLVWVWFNSMLSLGAGIEFDDFIIAQNSIDYLCYKVKEKSIIFLYEVNGDKYNTIKSTLKTN